MKSLTGLVEEINRYFIPILDALDEIAQATPQLKRAGTLAARDVEDIESVCRAQLDALPMAVGAGFVAAPQMVAAHERFLAWWQRSGDEHVRLRLNFDVNSIDVYDYIQMDWFRLARDSMRPSAYGPYVDYTGAGLYVITCARPVVRADAFVGVAGIDLAVDEVELGLARKLLASTRPAAVVNAEGRVVSTNTADWLVGTRVGEGEAVDHVELVGPDGWRLACATG